MAVSRIHQEAKMFDWTAGLSAGFIVAVAGGAFISAIVKLLM